ncbi:Na+/H+ antiporter subunit E [Agrococcus sp. ARC_14]|uniref:Na+/H+ antiporter subunit E n=1 Tax=Agrococcus sp. ARC_14 TaxID=2919927 RepID=UPI001F05C03A|nr:Na+/H+ antiporter subunit E [Agrococcus sp. ARC_14]MCH1882582.1 Na+/H+ antiporter subunit E [Agrococcus sp. ARC_14]
MNRPKLRYRISLVATIGLTIVWVMLWGEFTLGALIWGVLVALLIQVLFPLPEVPELESFRPIGFLRLMAVTLWGLLISSFQVAAKVLAFWRPTKNAIIRVPLRSDSAFITAITAELVTLVPGSVAIDAGEGWLLVHVFDASTPEQVEKARAKVRSTESTALRAFGTAEDRALLEVD